MLLPGAVLPAQPAYGALIDALGPDGAAALAFAARYPSRLLSLSLLEPAWAGTWDWNPAHARMWEEHDALASLPPGQFMPAFMRLSKVFPDFRLEVFEDRHHFDPPHRIEPDPLAGLLREHWDGAESRDHAEIR
jgi:pimeloyl-ACP methyl ester carboxylesterase